MITILILALVSNSIWATPIHSNHGDFANDLFALEKRHDKRIEENVMEMGQNRNENPEMLGQQVCTNWKSIKTILSLLTFFLQGGHLVNAMREALVQSFANLMESSDGSANLSPAELVALIALGDDKQMFAANRG